MRYRVLIPTLLLILSGCGGESAAGSSTTKDAGTTLAPTTLPPTTTTTAVASTITPEPEVVDPSTLHGTWLISKAESLYIAFHQDGTFAAAYDSAWEAPIDSGNRALDGIELTLNSGSDSRYCPSKSGRYQVAFSEDRLRVSLQESLSEECGGRRDSIGSAWRRVEER